MTLSGNRFFVGVIKLRQNRTKLWWALNLVTDIAERRGRFGHRVTHRGEDHVKTETKVGLMQLEAKECQGLLTATRSWKRQGRIFPQSFQREQGPAKTLIFRLLVSRSV